MGPIVNFQDWKKINAQNFQEWKEINEQSQYSNDKRLPLFKSGKLLLKLGSNDFDVYVVQKELQKRQVYSGPLSGEFDKATESAVRQFQKDNNLLIDGIVGPQTYGALFGEVSNSQKPGKVSPAKVFTYLAPKMTNHHAIGILANIQRESSFNSAAIGDSGTSGGLFQHHATRFQKMKAATGGDPKWATNWKGQIDFALSEPTGKKYLATKFTSPEQATRWFTKYFERPANAKQEAQTRVGLIPGILRSLKSAIS